MLKTGRYKHYKGGVYELIATGLQEADHQQVAVYKSLEASGEFPAGTVWVRPREEFVEKFTFID